VPRIARDITRFTRSEVEQLFAQAKPALRSTAFGLLRAPRQKEFGRVLIVTSRKVGNAPERNKIRRRLRSIFYEEKVFELLYDWIVLVKKNAVKLEFEELKKLFLGGILK